VPCVGNESFVVVKCLGVGPEEHFWEVSRIFDLLRLPLRASGRDLVSRDFWQVSISTAKGDSTQNPVVSEMGRLKTELCAL
jgi:hypothetical protein